eukprot:GSA120T00005836001.1
MNTDDVLQQDAVAGPPAPLLPIPTTSMNLLMHESSLASRLLSMKNADHATSNSVRTAGQAPGGHDGSLVH